MFGNDCGVQFIHCPVEVEVALKPTYIPARTRPVGRHDRGVNIVDLFVEIGVTWNRRFDAEIKGRDWADRQISLSRP